MQDIITELPFLEDDSVMTTKSEAEKLKPNPQDRIMCVKVGRIKRESLYEMARKYWKVDIKRASKATHVLAIMNGIVKTVYFPEKWKLTDNIKHAGRYEFVGEEDANNDYIGKSVKEYYGRSANPVLYINI